MYIKPIIKDNPSQKLRWIYLLAIAIACWLTATGGVHADPANPRPKEVDLEIENMSAFTGPDSFVQVRENSTEGTRLGLPDLGIHAAQIPGLNAAYWMNERNFLNLQLRYFAVRGSHFIKDPANFNGATIAGGQTVQTDPLWYSVGISYGHRWTPPNFNGWDLMARAGFEYTFINFILNKGHAAVTPDSTGTETKEDFYLQELPVPTMALELRRRVTSNLTAEGSIEGNWINHWNSQRTEGGTIYLSQRKLEAHVRIRLSNGRRFKSIHPMIGVFYYNFRQEEESAEDGNLIRWSSFGPELGLGYEF